MFTSIQIRSAGSKTTILGVWAETKRVPVALSKWKDACAEAISGHNFRGRRGETTRIGSVLFVGLGEKGKLKRHDVRSLGGSIVEALLRGAIHSVSIDIQHSIPRGVVSEAGLGQLLGEGMTIANWRVDQYDGSATKRSEKVRALTVTSSSKSVSAGLQRGVVLGNAVNDARRIAATPPNICNPPGWPEKLKKLQSNVD